MERVNEFTFTMMLQDNAQKDFPVDVTVEDYNGNEYYVYVEIDGARVDITDRVTVAEQGKIFERMGYEWARANEDHKYRFEERY